MLNKLRQLKEAQRAKAGRFTLIELLTVIAILVIVALMVVSVAAFIFVSCVAVNKVQEEGLKGAAEQIWEGPDASEGAVEQIPLENVSEQP